MECRTISEAINYFFAAPLGIFFNIIALFIIRKASILELSSFKIVLYATTFSDLFIALLSFLMDLHSSHSLDNVLVMTANGWISLLINRFPTLLQFLVPLYNEFQVAIGNLAVPPFVYRWLLICRNVHISYFKVFLLYLLFLFPLILHQMGYTYLVINYAPYHQEKLLQNETFCSKVIFTTYSIDDVPREDKISRIIFTTNALLSSTTILNYVIILFCCIKIVSLLHRHEHLFHNTHIQKGITRTLMIQALIPFLITGAPAIFFIVSFLIYKDQNYDIVKIIYDLRMLVPIINPLAMLYFIKPYRSTLMDLLRGRNYVQRID